MTLLLGILVVVLLIFGLRETPITKQPKEHLYLTLQPFDRNFRLYLLALGIFTLGNSSDAFLFVRAEELGEPTLELPLLWSTFHIVKSSSNLLLGRAVARFGPRRFIYLGWFLYAGIYLAFSVAAKAWEVWVLFLSYALSTD